jgi:hypothetical protein
MDGTKNNQQVHLIQKNAYISIVKLIYFSVQNQQTNTSTLQREIKNVYKGRTKAKQHIFK